jgi:MYXO-CTERM domain-containing protein
MGISGTSIVVAIPGVAAALVSANLASASFVGYFVTSTNTSLNGQNLVVYTLAARFDYTKDTVFAADNLTATDSGDLTGFWHKDNSGNNDLGATLSQTVGSWSPLDTGSSTYNRPYDSYLTIGSIARAGNETEANVAWYTGGNADTRGWNRPDLPDNGGLGWYADEGGGQGRAGNSAGLGILDVRLGQFVLSVGHAARTMNLDIIYSRGADDISPDGEHPIFHASGSFTLGTVPAPGALALIGLAGFAARSRRR